MSHNIQFFDYPENVNKKAVQAKLDDYVAHEDWQEGCSGLYNKIRWLDPICDSQEDAEHYIEAHDRKDYDCLAVRFRVAAKTSSKLEQLQEKCRECNRDYAVALAGDNYPATRKSEYIGCPSCGSKLNRKILAKSKKPNICPVCGTDLRPASLREREVARFAKAKASKESTEKALKEEKKKLAKASKTIRWLVKIEYHT